MVSINYSDIYNIEQNTESDGSIVLDSIYNDDKIVVYNQNNLISRRATLLDFINSVDIANNNNHLIFDVGSFGSLTLGTLGDVNITGVGEGDVLQYVDNQWVPTPYSEITTFLADLGDVYLGTLAGGEVLTYDITQQRWEAATINVVVSVNGKDGSVTLTTSDISEGNNLYYTNNRVDTRIGQTSIDVLSDVNKTGWAQGKVWGFDVSGNTVPLDMAEINGISLTDLIDTNISNLSNGQTITWNAAQGKFVNSSVAVITSTDDVPQGVNNKYYSNGLVNTWANNNSIDVFQDINVYGATNGQLLQKINGVWQGASVVLPSTTDDLPQGSTNKYYANALVNTWANAASIDVFQDVNKTGWTTGQVLGFDSNGILIPVDVLTSSTTTDSIPAGTNPARQYFSNTLVGNYLSTVGLSVISGVGGIGGSTPQGGQALIYNSTTQRYEPGAVGVLTITLTYNSPGDTKGLIYWCGSVGFKQSFSNPANRTAPYNLTVTLSSNIGNEPSNAIDRNVNTIIQTASQLNSRFVLDLGSDKLIKPNYYTIRGRNDTNTRHLRNWKLQGSLDQSTWDDLDTQVNNNSIGQGSYFTGSCTATTGYRYISILLTDVESSGTYYLTMSDFDIYGTVTIAGAESATTTDDLPEGIANLYYTDARVQSYLNGSATVNGSKLTDNTVTLAKLEQLNQNQLLGRATAGTGTVEAITLGTGLSFTGTTLNVTNSGVTSVVGQTGVITATQIATGLNGLTGADRISYNSLKDTPSVSTNTYGSFYAATPTVKNIPLFTATRATTINELRGVDTSAGTATISIQINGVNVTGLTNLSVTSTPQNFTATGANTVSVGARVTVNITAVSSGADLEFTIGATLN